MHRIIDWNELWKAIHASSPDHAAMDRDPAAVWWEKDDRWPVDSDQRRRALHRPQSLRLRGTSQP